MYFSKDVGILLIIFHQKPSEYFTFYILIKVLFHRVLMINVSGFVSKSDVSRIFAKLASFKNLNTKV